jgi:hypothetical protein
MSTRNAVKGFAVILILIVSTISAAYSQTKVEVTSYLDRDEVLMGERFIFEIRVRGGKTIGSPDFSHLAPLFDVQPIDRRYVRYYLRNRKEQLPDAGEKVDYYRFIALHSGDFQIGAIPLEIDGKTYLTQTHSIRVDEPEESSFFKLSLSLSKEEAYEGEAVVLTAVWYYRDTARYYNYLFPILQHPDILTGEYVEDQANDTLVLPFGSGRVPVEMGSSNLEGLTYNTITFRQYLIPQKAGFYQFARGTVQLWRPKKNYTTNPSDYETMVVASKSFNLRVRGLPPNRPARFTGLVGEGIDVSTTAAPVEVTVGDPITFNITLSGATSLENANLPPLSEQPRFDEQFAFIPYRASERMEGKLKVFTRVIRARSHEVLEIPPVEVVYFDTGTRSYEVAASEPVPLVVRSTRVLLDEDLEGESAKNSIGRVTDSETGINYNYEGVSLLVQDSHDSLSTLLAKPFLLVTLITPVLAFGFVVGLSRLKSGRTARYRARQQRLLVRDLKTKARRFGAGEVEVTEQVLLDGCMELLGLKLGFPTLALTYEDVERVFRERRIDTDILPQLKILFSLHDRARYAYGGVNEVAVKRSRSGPDSRGLSSLVLRISRELERRIPQ